MPEKGFSVGQLVKLGWRRMKENIEFFIPFLIVIIFLNLIPSIISYFYGGGDPAVEPSAWFAVGIVILSIVIGLMVSMAVVRVSLDIADGQKGHFRSLVTQFPLILKFFIAQIFYGLIIVLPVAVPAILAVFLGSTFEGILGSALATLFGVIAGIMMIFVAIWGIKFSLYPYFVIDRRSGPVEALQGSGEITEGAKWDVFALYFVLSVINILGALCLILGLFATYPVFMVAGAAAYRTLSKQAQR